jgi:hypothetical protein
MDPDPGGPKHADPFIITESFYLGVCEAVPLIKLVRTYFIANKN